MLSKEAAITNYVDFGLIRLGLKHMLYCNLGENGNKYITDMTWIYTKEEYHRYDQNVKYVWNTADMTEMLNNGNCIARTR